MHNRQSCAKAAERLNCRCSRPAHSPSSRDCGLAARDQSQPVVMMTTTTRVQQAHMTAAAPVRELPTSCCCCYCRCHHDRLLVLNDSSVTLRHCHSNSHISAIHCYTTLSSAQSVHVTPTQYGIKRSRNNSVAVRHAQCDFRPLIHKLSNWQIAKIYSNKMIKNDDS